MEIHCVMLTTFVYNWGPAVLLPEMSVSLSVCIYLSVSLFICLSVSLSARITEKPCVRTSPNFWACCLQMWLGHPLMALRYIMYFWFCGWRYVFIPWSQWVRIKHDVMFRRSSPGGGTSLTPDNYLLCLVEFISIWHWGETWYLILPCCHCHCLRRSKSSLHQWWW